MIRSRDTEYLQVRVPLIVSFQSWPVLTDGLHCRSRVDHEARARRGLITVAQSGTNIYLPYPATLFPLQVLRRSTSSLCTEYIRSTTY
jgi:hypothetical protein